MTRENLLHLKILMLLDNPFSSDARVEKEAATLINAGAKVTLVCTKQNGLPEREERDGIIILRWIEEGYNAPLRKGYAKYKTDLARLINPLHPTVVHCHDFYMLSIGVSLKKMNPDIHLIYDAHEFLKGWPFYKVSLGINKWKGLLVYHRLLQLERKEIKSADTVITITDAIAERFYSWASLKKKPIVIGNYPESVQLNTESRSLHTFFTIASDKKILIHSGTIYQSDQQLDELFNFLQNDDRFVLVFVGNRPRFNEIKTRVQSNANWKNVVFFHDYPTTQKETIQLLSTADIGLLIINNEWEAHNIGFSNRFVEYIMAGIPVIATPQKFTKDFNNKHKVATFFNSKNFREFEAALNTLFQDYQTYKLNAVEASKEITWEHESKKLIELYSSI